MRTLLTLLSHGMRQNQMPSNYEDTTNITVSWNTTESNAFQL